MMDAVCDPANDVVVIMKSAQVGYTEILMNINGYFIDQDPSPILNVQPTVEMGQTFSKDRIAPMVRDTPCLTEKVAEAGSKKSGNTMLHKTFPGGHLTITGANSAAGLASRPIRIALFDEVDRYPPSAGSEGDPVSLGKKRTRTFWNRKIVLGSTPTDKGISRIEDEWNKSDKRRYFVPCPHCGEQHHFQFKDFHFREIGSPDEPVWVCPDCGGMVVDADKHDMIAAGEWIATAEFDGIAGFHINEFYSPWSTWSEMIKEFLRVKSNPVQLKTWVNTSLGETWEEKGASLDPDTIAARAEMYQAQAPLGVQLITAGVDVQKDRFEVDVYGWSETMEGWHIDRQVIPADTSQLAEWTRLDDYLLNAQFEHQAGSQMQIVATCVDSSYLTDVVYAYCAKRYARHIYAIKGDDGAGKPIAKVMAKPRTPGPKPPRMFVLGSDTIKGLIHSGLKMDEPGPGYLHFNTEQDQEFFNQLASEKPVAKMRRGFRVIEWEKVKERNEAFDNTCYARAAVTILNPVWSAIIKKNEKRQQNIEPEVEDQPTPAKQAQKARKKTQTRRRKSNYVGRWK